MAGRVAQIIVRIKGGVRAALEARAVAAGLEEVADGADDVRTSALAAGLAMNWLERAERRVARANAMLGATSVPAVGGLTLMAVGSIPLAFVILPALAVAMWQVIAAAAVLGTATIAAAGGVFAAVALLSASVITRFRRMKDVVGSAAYELSNQLWLLKETFLEITSGAADSVMAGLARGIGALLPLVRSLRGHFDAIGAAIGGVLAELGRRLAGMGPEIGALLAQVPAVVEALGAFAGDALALFVQLATVGAPVLVSALRTVAGWMRSLTDWFTPEQVDQATSTLRAFFDGVSAWWAEFTDPISKVLGPALDEGADALHGWARPLGVISAALIQIGRVLLPPLAALLGAVSDEVTGVGTGIEGLDVKGIAGALVTGVKWMIRWVGKFADSIKPLAPIVENILAPLTAGLLMGFIGPVLDIVKAVATVIGFIGKLAAPLRPLFYWLGQAVSVIIGGELLRGAAAILKMIPLVGRLSGLVRLVGEGWNLIAGIVGRAIGLIISRLGPLGEFVGGAILRFDHLRRYVGALPAAIASAASGLWDGLKNGLGPIVDWIRDKLRWIIDKIEWAVEKVGSLEGAVGRKAGDILGFDPTPGFDVPFLASGGVLQRGGLAVVGERGPELVRLPTGAAVYDAQTTRGFVSPIAAPAFATETQPPYEAQPTRLAATIPVTLVLPNGRELARAVHRQNVNVEARA